MTSSGLLIFLLLLFFITLAESEKKKSGDKIIIHVPYKIHKHHHTHTKYKVITIPAAKHENTVIYLKEHQQEIKPEVQSPVQQLEESNFMPPHQQSAAILLEHLQNYKKKAKEPEELKLDQVTNDQKSQETSNSNFFPYFEFQPIITPVHKNMIPQPQFLLNPDVFPQQQMFIPKYVINPKFQHNFIPNFDYKTIFQPPLQSLIPNYTIKHNLPLTVPQDNVAHSTTHEYKMVLTKPKSESYQVKEEVQEENHKHLQKTLKITVPQLKLNRKGKTYMHSSQKYNSKIKTKMVPTDPNYEFQHVGYLIIDGKSKKIVGKNFKDEIHLNR